VELVLDADADAPSPWLATAYVAGPSLAQAVREYGPLPMDSMLALAAGLAESLAAIHAAGVVHRDLKPSSVLLAKDGPRVIDFGISQIAGGTSLTSAGFVVGTPEFMSPEQAEGHTVGSPSDVFSLGAVLAFAASGKAPFGTGSTAALTFRIVHQPPDLEGVPGPVRALVERCLAKDPSQRPSAADFLTQVVQVVQPAGGWLPEPVRRAFIADRAPAAASTADSAELIPFDDQTSTPPASERTVTGWRRRSPRPQTGRRRRRIWRPLVMMWVCVTFLAASTGAGFALNAAASPSPPPARLRPQPVESLVPSPTVSASGALRRGQSRRIV
jgi:eukaryotic-like serine/threonine-protein kinase